MPINLCKHVKLWFHPEGFIPDKIINRLVFQKKIRSGDCLTFFVNQICIENNLDKINQLKKQEIQIKIIEDCLAKPIDDEYLVSYAKYSLAVANESKERGDSISVSSILRLLKMVQKEGLYSDNDVLFLNFNDSKLLMKQYLFGCHAQGVPDIHIFGLDINYSDNFYRELKKKIKSLCGEPPYFDGIRNLPGLAFIPDELNLYAYGHLNFPATKENIIYCKEQPTLKAHEELDPILVEAEEALKQGFVSTNLSFR